MIGRLRKWRADRRVVREAEAAIACRCEFESVIWPGGWPSDALVSKDGCPQHDPEYWKNNKERET